MTSELMERLNDYIDDPMWADHAEVSQIFLSNLRAELSRLTREVEALREANGCGFLNYWFEGSEIIEKCLAKATVGDHSDAPFGMDHGEAQLWQAAHADAYRHSLEMMGVPKLSRENIRRLATTAKEG